MLQDTEVRTSAAAIFFMSAATNEREREGTKDSASHEHDSSNLSALPLESYDLVTKKESSIVEASSKEHAQSSKIRSCTHTLAHEKESKGKAAAHHQK